MGKTMVSYKLSRYIDKKAGISKILKDIVAKGKTVASNTVSKIDQRFFSDIAGKNLPEKFLYKIYGVKNPEEFEKKLITILKNKFGE